VTRLAQIPRNWPKETVPRDLEYAATARTREGTVISARGRVADIWVDYFGGDHDVDIHVASAAPLASAMSFGLLRGDDLTADFRVTGPVIAPQIEIGVAGMALKLPAPGSAPPLELTIAPTHAVLDFSTEGGRVEPTVVRGAGGEVKLRGRFDFHPWALEFDAEVKKPLELSPYLPPRVTKLAGGSKLSGSLHAFGSARVQKLDPVDLLLGGARMRGTLSRSDQGVVEAKNLRVQRGGTTLERVNGTLDWNRREFQLVFGVHSGDFAQWLATLRAPRLASSVDGSGKIEGSFDSLDRLRGNGTFTFTGVPVVGEVATSLEYGRHTLEVTNAESHFLGGDLSGSGKIELRGTPRFIGFSAAGKGLRLDRLPHVGAFLAGRGSFELHADGPIAAPTAHLSGALTEWSIDGDPYRPAHFDVARRQDGGWDVRGQVEREQGGALFVDAGVTSARTLRGQLSLRNLPLEAVLALTGVDAFRAGGTVNAQIELNGSTRAPTGEGYLGVLGFWLGNAFLGTAGLHIEREGEGLLRVTGSLFQGKIGVDGTVETRLPLTTDVRLTLRRMELDLLFPELAEKLSARAWVSGEVHARGSLLSHIPPVVTANLEEAVVLLANEDASGRPAPIRFKTSGPLKLSWERGTLEFLQPAVVQGPAGDFELWGKGRRDALDFHARGAVTVKMLEPYLRQYFEDMTGKLTLQAHLSGTLDKRVYTGVVEFENVAIKPQGQDAIVAVPTGKVEITNEQLAVTGVRVVVVDEYSDERSTLTVAGGVKLEDLKPRSWALRIDGELAGKMLLVVMPEAFSAASGSADISVSLRGRGTVPSLDGTIEFRAKNALKFTPRGWRREFTLTSGTIKGADKLIELSGVGGWIDDEGQIVSLDGQVRLAQRGPLTLANLMDWKLEAVEMALVARDLPVRFPGELELSINLPNLRIKGAEGSRYKITGRAEIVDGRYIRRWQPVLDAIRPVRSSETSPPFYAGKPWLANAELGVFLDVRNFLVKNNLAQISLKGKLEISGSPADPRFEGQIQVEQGSFKFQGIRAQFTRTAGSLDFDREKDFPTETPILNITSESDFRDFNGQDHVVQLTLKGPIANLDWDLSTNSGLNKAQTFTLIFAGRTPEETRRVFGDEAIGARPGPAGTQVSTAEGPLQAADQVVKDLAGDFFALLIEDPIRNFTSLDVARLELGTSSVGFRGEKSFTKSLRVVGEVDRSLRGWSWDVRGEYRLTDSISMDGEVLQKRFDAATDVEADQTNLRAKFTWRKILLP
jgi:hypothetical protein